MKIDVDDLSALHVDSRTRKQGADERLSSLLKAYACGSILAHHGEYFGHLAPLLGQPDPIDEILIHKMIQIPCHSMNVKESTPDGNVEVVECLLRQGGIGEPDDKNFDPEDVDMSESVLLVHGDLLTKEWLDTVQASRHIEAMPK